MKSIPIIFNGGAYGTFAEWALTYFGGLTETLPFNSNGNSHKFQGNHILDMTGWREHITGAAQPTLVRMHPKTAKTENVIDNVNEILESADKAILLHCTGNSIVCNINNKFDKIWDDYAARMFTDELVGDQLAHWGSRDYQSLEVWQRREFLSLFAISQHLAEAEFDKVIAFSHPKILKIAIEDLFESFEETIRKALAHCSIPIVRTNFTEIYKEWYPLQIHAHKDSIVNSIIDAVLGGKFISWDQLSLIDEAFIQMRLRDLHSLDMLCYNINVFPRNTTDLRKILKSQ